MIRAPIASFALLQQHDLRWIWVVRRLYRRSLTLRILLTSLVHHSWDFGIGVHCVGSRRLDCESGYGESRSVGFVEGCANGDGVNEIGLSVGDSQKNVGST